LIIRYLPLLQPLHLERFAIRWNQKRLPENALTF